MAIRNVNYDNFLDNKGSTSSRHITHTNWFVSVAGTHGKMLELTKKKPLPTSRFFANYLAHCRYL